MKHKTYVVIEKDAVVFNFGMDETKEEVQSLLLRYADDALNAGNAFVGFVTEDKREIFQLPQAVAFCKMLVHSGLLSVLSCANDTGPYGTMPALYVYACANGWWEKPGAEWGIRTTKERMVEFDAAVDRSVETLAALKKAEANSN
jgi:hypothetical protein